MSFRSKNLWNYIAFFSVASLWGGSYTAIKFAVLQFPPFFSAMLRVIIAQLSLALIVYVCDKPIRLPARLMWKTWLVGLFPLGIPFALLFWGERFISPGLAGVICATMPLWVLILGLIFIPASRSLSVSKIVGLIIGLVGVCVIFAPMITFDGSDNEIIGTIAVLLMAIAYAIGALLNQRLLKGKTIPIYTHLFHQNLSSAIFLILLSIIFEKWPSLNIVFSSSNLWLASLYLGIFSTAVAWLLYYHLIHQWGAIRATAAAFVAPIMAILWDYLFFHNYPGFSEALGALIILSGVFLIQFSRY